MLQDQETILFFSGIGFDVLFLTQTTTIGFLFQRAKASWMRSFLSSLFHLSKTNLLLPFLRPMKNSTPIDLRKGIQAQQEQDGVPVDRRPEAEHGPCAGCRLSRVAFRQLVCLLRQCPARLSRHLQPRRPKRHW